MNQYTPPWARDHISSGSITDEWLIGKIESITTNTSSAPEQLQFDFDSTSPATTDTTFVSSWQPSYWYPLDTADYNREKHLQLEAWLLGYLAAKPNLSKSDLKRIREHLAEELT